MHNKKDGFVYLFVFASLCVFILLSHSSQRSAKRDSSCSVKPVHKTSSTDIYIFFAVDEISLIFSAPLNGEHMGVFADVMVRTETPARVSVVTDGITYVNSL